MKNLYAHTPNDQKKWHDLDKHLLEVAELAQCFADKFGAGAPAYWAGLWHDLGKVLQEFQDYLIACSKNQKSNKFPHAIWGGVLAYYLLTAKELPWEELALLISGHHGGLNHPGSLSQKLSKCIEEQQPNLKELLNYACKLPVPQTYRRPELNRVEFELYIRMIYSALVDADYLNTEKHFNKKQYDLRQRRVDLESLLMKFKNNQKKLIALTKKKSTVNRVRKEVFDYCTKSALEKPGLFRLTVPTGGGKTRSGLSFALEHAVAWRMDRVVVAIPFTSIIDQTAKEYRKILGNDSVLEHHSQVSAPADESQNEDQVRLKLSSENWAAPVIVTTTVQLFESLFSNQPGKVRKLHNLAKSVIVLDEVQALPPQLLIPTLDVLKELVARYGATVVLCTATQPEFEAVEGSIWSKVLITDIVPIGACREHFKDLRRVEYHNLSAISWGELADRINDTKITESQQVLVVVNTKKDALSLISSFDVDDSVFHLSTGLCGAHRRLVLHKVKQRLKNGLPVKLISTQVIEAGVDIDFPVVYRAVGPLDRVVQAAGRCNREGKRSAASSHVYIFEPTGGRVPRGPYKTGLEKTRLLFREHAPEELHQPELCSKYFSLLFDPNTGVDCDKKRIQNSREHLDFPEVAEKYKMIEQDTSPVVIPCEVAHKRLEEWQRRPSRRTWQRLQPLVVTIYNHEIQKMLKDEEVVPVSEGLYLARGNYDRLKGLTPAVYDPCDLITYADGGE